MTTKPYYTVFLTYTFTPDRKVWITPPLETRRIPHHRVEYHECYAKAFDTKMAALVAILEYLNHWYIKHTASREERILSYGIVYHQRAPEPETIILFHRDEK